MAVTKKLLDADAPKIDLGPTGNIIVHRPNSSEVIASDTVEAHLLYAILRQLEKNAAP